MKCPFCDKDDLSVLESRDSEDNEVVRRRRECSKCKKRFTTYERIEGSQLLVIKKEGKKEVFDKEKIRKGVMRACEKRTVDFEAIEKIIDQVEREMMNKKNNEIESRVIGNAVLRRLKKIDKVAYVRFASVYLDFDNIKNFTKLVKEIRF